MPRIPPRDYFDVLDAIHVLTFPRTYVEVGVASGRSLSIARPGTLLVGVDPDASLGHPVSGPLALFRQTSDLFFAGRDLRNALGAYPVDVAFIDGLHHFEVVLRDFRSLEAAAASESIILIHDCVPPSPRVAARDRETKLWTGDVWKAIVGLRQYRPDLKIEVLDVAPTGLAVVSELHPSSRVLYDRYEEICAHLSSIVLPEDKDERTSFLGVTTPDWSTWNDQLPRYRNGLGTSRPARIRQLHPPIRHLTLDHARWRLRRWFRFSAFGRVVRGFMLRIGYDPNEAE